MRSANTSYADCLLTLPFNMDRIWHVIFEYLWMNEDRSRESNDSFNGHSESIDMMKYLDYSRMSGLSKRAVGVLN